MTRTEEEGGLNELILSFRILSVWVVSFGFHLGFSAVLEMPGMLGKDTFTDTPAQPS